MEDYVVWFVTALILAVIEIMSGGTFYILVLALAAVLGGVVALIGLGPDWQYALAGIAAIAGTMALYHIRAARPLLPVAEDNLDIGQPVKVIRWNEDGTARVRYRGADWDADLEHGTPRQETLFIRSVQGNRLILVQHKP
jgi:membrane protein implicated in regulation of membrane protease activity